MEINNKSVNLIKNTYISKKEKPSTSQQEEKDISNSPNPAEYLGRSQIIFRGKTEPAKSTKFPKIKKENLTPIKLTKSPIASKKEIVELLKTFQYSNEEIAQIDLNNPEMIEKLSGLIQYFEIDNMKADMPEIIEQFKNYTSEERLDFINEELPDNLIYWNRENIDNLHKYIDFDFDDTYSIFDVFNNNEHSNDILEKLPIAYYAQGKLNRCNFESFARLDNLDNLTYERADILRRINNLMPENNTLPAAQCSNLGNDEDLKPASVENYLNLLQKFGQNKSFDITTLTPVYQNKSLKELTETMTQVNNVLEQYPIDFSLTEKDTKFSITDLEKITQREDIADVQEYINSLTPEAKSRGIIEIPKQESKLDKKKLAFICNTIYNKDYGNVSYDSFFKYLHSQEENGYKNIDGIIKLINRYKGTDVLNTDYVNEKLTVGQDDYDSAITALDLRDALAAKNLRFPTWKFNEILNNPETDLKEFNKILSYINDNNIEQIYPDYFLSDEKGFNKLVLHNNIGRHMSYDNQFKLNSFAETLNNDEELFYALDLFQQKSFPDSEDYSYRFGWDIDDIKEIMQSYQNDKEATKAIVDMKVDNSKNWRIINKKNIMPVIEAYQKDKDFTLELLNLKTSKGDYRFYDGDDIKTLVETASIDKNYTLELLNKPDNFSSRKKYRFDAKSIKDVVKAAQINREFTQYLTDLDYTDDYGYKHYAIPANCSKDFIYFAQKVNEDEDFVKFLFNEKKKDYNGNESPRFQIDTIEAVLDNPPENKEFLLELINTKEKNYWREEDNKYNNDDISSLAKSAQINKDLTEQLINSKITVTNYDGKKEDYTRFKNTADIYYIVKESVIDPEFAQELISEMTESYNGDLQPRFDSSGICRLLRLCKTEDKNEIKNLMKETVSTYDNRTEPRFDYSDIEIIFSCYKQDRELTDKLLAEKYTSSGGNEYYRYSTTDINSIVTANTVDKEFTNELLERNRLNKNNNLYLEGYDIKSLVNIAQKDKDLTKALLNYTILDDNGREKYRFSIDDIERLVYAKNNSNIPIEQYIELKDSNNQYLDVKTISNLCKSVENYPELIENILSRKNSSGNLDLTGKGLNKFLTGIRFCDDNILELQKSDEYKDTIFKMSKNDEYKDYDISLYTNFYKFLSKDKTYELTKTEKKDLLMKLLVNKRSIQQGNHLNNELIPNGDKEYAKLIKDITNSLSLNIEPLTKDEQDRFNNLLTDLTYRLKDLDLSELNSIELNMPQSEFNAEVNQLIKDLPKDEQAKIQDYFGFRIENDRLTGYPRILTENPSKTDITNEKSLKALEKVKTLVEKYTNNNFITVRDIPELNKQLKSISKYLPELYNQIDGSNTFVNTLKSLQKIVITPKFETLTDDDKKVVILATLLHNTDKDSGSTSESAFDAYFISKKLGISDEIAQKIYKVVESSDLINKFMSAKPDEIVINTRNSHIKGKDRENVFDLLAFNLKESNLFELSQMLYTTKEKDGLTRHLDKLLEKRIQEIKSSDFILPQTQQQTYLDYASEQEINGHNVLVAEADKIPDLHAYIHTPEAGFATGGTRYANLSNFEIFKDFSDNKIICTSYVTADKAALVKEYRHGFIFDVKNDKQYVAYNRDIFSLAKNIPNMLIEYYRDRGFTANRGKGEKFSHRTNVSDKLKKAMRISDEEYIKKLDNIKSQLGSETLSMEKLKSIDLELYNAYQTLFESNYLLNSEYHNEALVSSPQIQAIFTNDLENLPEEYLKMAEEQNLPIVVFNTKRKQEETT